MRWSKWCYCIQQHIVLQKGNTMDEILEAASEFEKIAKLGKKKSTIAAVSNQNGELSKLSSMMNFFKQEGEK